MSLKPLFRSTRIFCAAALAAIMMAARAAAYINIYGGPTYTPGVGGFLGGFATGVNDAGVAIGAAYKYDASGTDLGARPFRWDGSGSAATELGNLGTDIDGVAISYAYAINNAGTAVGFAEKYDGLGEYPASLPVRWDASGTVATELGHFGTDTSNYALNYANAINDDGTAVGSVRKYDGSGGDLGVRAVRWDASGTVATELEHLGTETSGNTYADATAINDAGTIVGSAWIYDSSGVPLGTRAVRWDASGTTATELGHLGTDSNDFTYSGAYAINDAGTAIGWAHKHGSEGAILGVRPVRWDASGTVATELGNLGTDVDGVANNYSVAINNDGTIVGDAEKYDGSGEALGRRAVRWDASNTVATELGNLGTDPNGVTDGGAYDVNSAGIAVGFAADYDGSHTLQGDRATYWGLDGVAVDLNTLVDPASGWTLEYADAISDTGWIAGTGTFDPDGPDGQEAYQRLFLLQLQSRAGDFDSDGDVDGHDFLVWQRGESANPLSPSDLADWQVNYGTGPLALESVAIPEPASLALLALAMLALLRRRRGPHCFWYERPLPCLASASSRN